MTGRGRPPLAIGTYGKITVIGDRKPYRARARFRDLDGVTRPVVKTSDTKGRAERALKQELAARSAAIHNTAIRPETTIAQLADLWHEAHQERWAVNTRDTYGYVIANQIKPQLGSVRLLELRPSLIASALVRMNKTSGQGAAKTAKTVLAGMCDWAVTMDAMPANPARGKLGATISRKPRKEPRALTVEQTDELCDKLRSDPRATEVDLPDLVEWMLGTGARIGEACAARRSVLDLKHGTWEVNATLIRVKGEGMRIQPRPKTKAGWRVLALPSHLVVMVQRRTQEEKIGLRFGADEGVIFASPHDRALRDKRNTSRDLRAALDRLGFDWVTSHTFRKTVATRMDEAGCSSRVIADQLGHAKPSMTLDVYMGRKVVSAKAAEILER